MYRSLRSFIARRADEYLIFKPLRTCLYNVLSMKVFQLYSVPSVWTFLYCPSS